VARHLFALSRNPAIYGYNLESQCICLTSLATLSASAQRVSAPIVPDPAKTPGDTLAVTKSDTCVPGYSKKVRNVPESVKKQAYAEYGITSHKPKEYEVDHLISLELGGSNSLKNLWPQLVNVLPSEQV
jgi:hypothetical protein